VIGLVVITIKGFFSDCKCRLDCEGVVAIGGSCSEVLVDVVHGWYDRCDARGPSGKKKGRVLEDLIELLC
jgi:hypothetical protein